MTTKFKKFFTGTCAALGLIMGLSAVSTNVQAKEDVLKPLALKSGYTILSGQTNRGTKETFFIDPYTLQVKNIMGTSPLDAIEKYDHGPIPEWFRNHGIEIFSIYDYDTEYVLYVDKELGDVVLHHENTWSLPIR